MKMKAGNTSKTPVSPVKLNRTTSSARATMRKHLLKIPIKKIYPFRCLVQKTLSFLSTNNTTCNTQSLLNPERQFCKWNLRLTKAHLSFECSEFFK